MDAYQLIYLAENGTYRLNVLYFSAAVITLLSWSATTWASFAMYFVYYCILEAILIALGVLAFTGSMFLMSQFDNSAPSADLNEFFDFDEKHKAFEDLWKGKKNPNGNFY
jgi:hypothetical protein